MDIERPAELLSKCYSDQLLDWASKTPLSGDNGGEHDVISDVDTMPLWETMVVMQSTKRYQLKRCI